MTLLTDALGDLDRLVALLYRVSEVIQRANARVQNRNAHPSLAQLLRNPLLLEYTS